MRRGYESTVPFGIWKTNLAITDPRRNCRAQCINKDIWWDGTSITCSPILFYWCGSRVSWRSTFPGPASKQILHLSVKNVMKKNKSLQKVVLLHFGSCLISEHKFWVMLVFWVTIEWCHFCPSYKHDYLLFLRLYCATNTGLQQNPLSSS